MSNNMIGQTLAGRYRVEDAIGRGGMAEVYKVWDTHRAVHLAMKVLREDIAQDRVFIRRFKREAQTLAALQHPNIVRLYGLEQDDLLVFMLMDYVEGTNLRAEILRAQGPVAPERVLEVMRPVCSALHYAHKQGVIHCDIKPGNIMIDKRGTVLVADFGIARAAEGATVTMVGVGTPAYMAPELVMGQAPSPQTDIYALGVVLYEMLTGGERPFTGEHAKTTGTTAEKVRWEQLKLRPPSPRTYNPAISPEVETVVLGCLGKKPEQRYPGPLDVLNALERAMGSAEIASPPVAEARPAPRVESPVVADAQPERVRVRPPSDSQPVRRRGVPVWVWVVGAVVGLAVILGAVALGGTGRASVVPTETAAATVVEATSTDIPTLDASSEHGNVPASCESPAEPIGPIQDSSQHIDDAVDEEYPANCSYYCTEVQPDADSLKVDIDNFDADLDLFIGLGAISSVMGTEADENPWKSNETDTSSESVTVSSPEAGIYYIEVCSYDGSPSDYNLSVSIP